MQCGDVEKLIKKRSSPQESPLFYVTIEETFDIIKRAHVSTGHGGRDRMLKELQKKYANITTKAVELFKSLCEECQKKRTRPKTKGVVVRPILSKEFASRGQVDLIDFQSMPYAGHRWIMVYQDHLTKFVILRALKSKRAAEVAYQLMDVFLTFGAPVVLQSDNGSEFTSHVITELKYMWPDLTMVHGKPRHPQSQGSVERANSDIKDMLAAWLSDNSTDNWVSGIKFVQFHKNSAHHAGIKCSPYSAMFGSEARVGLTSSSLPAEIIARMQSENDLLAAVCKQTPEPLNTSTSGGTVSSLPSTSGDTVSSLPSTSGDTVSSLPSTSGGTVSSQPSTSENSSSDASEREDEGLNIANRTAQIRKRRGEACIGQMQQAERMTKRSRIDFKAAEVGDNVAVPIPTVDRGRGDPRNILGIVINKQLETEQYKIAVKAGVLNGLYSRNQFDLCPQRLLTEKDVDLERPVSLRTAVIAQSASGGQGFTKCNCSGNKKCKTNRCKCFKSKLKCNSRCHSSLSCSNKCCE